MSHEAWLVHYSPLVFSSVHIDSLHTSTLSPWHNYSVYTCKI